MRSCENCEEFICFGKQVLDFFALNNFGFSQQLKPETVSSDSSTTVPIFETNSALDRDLPAAR